MFKRVRAHRPTGTSQEKLAADMTGLSANKSPQQAANRCNAGRDCGNQGPWMNWTSALERDLQGPCPKHQDPKPQAARHYRLPKAKGRHTQIIVSSLCRCPDNSSPAVHVTSGILSRLQHTRNRQTKKSASDTAAMGIHAMIQPTSAAKAARSDTTEALLLRCCVMKSRSRAMEHKMSEVKKQERQEAKQEMCFEAPKHVLNVRMLGAVSLCTVPLLISTQSLLSSTPKGAKSWAGWPVGWLAGRSELHNKKYYVQTCGMNTCTQRYHVYMSGLCSCT